MLDNDSGGVHGTLLGATDHCVSGPGRRLLRRWLGRPLARVADIARRQDAVAALLGPASDAAREARSKLRGAAAGAGSGTVAVRNCSDTCWQNIQG